MTLPRLIAAAALTLVSMTATAHACDEECKDAEIYSDEAEMCVPKPVES